MDTFMSIVNILLLVFINIIAIIRIIQTGRKK